MSTLVLKTEWHYEENRKFAATDACTKRDVETLVSLVEWFVSEEGVKAGQTTLLTKTQYKSAVRQWIRYCWPDEPTDFEISDDPKPGPDVPLLRARKEDVRHWIKIMLEVERKEVTTVQVYLAALKLFYRALVVVGAMTVVNNPCLEVKSPRDGRDQAERGEAMPEKYVQKLYELNTPKPLEAKKVSEEERNEFLRRVRNQLLLRLWADCGLREREAFRLKMSDVRLESDIYLMVTGKGGKVAPTSLNQKTLQAYNLWLGYRDMIAKKDVPEIIVNVSSSKKGYRVSSHASMWNIMAQMWREAEIPKDYWGVHCLRHRYVEVALDQGVPMETVSAGARHSSFKTTIDIYGKRKIKHLPQIADVFDRM
jgi:site-specific recombinase XerD